MNRKAITIYTLAAVAILIALGYALPIDSIMSFWPAITLASHALLAAGILSLLFARDKVVEWLGSKGTYLAFVVSGAATLGSLFYSEIAGLTPCRLCWFQRVFMYPLPLLLLIAYFYGEDIKKYVLTMSWLGGLIAAFHYATQFVTFVTSCGIGDTSCSEKLAFHYGYITIPLMAATAFALVIILLWLQSKTEQ